jgi:hypothetical protein
VSLLLQYEHGFDTPRIFTQLDKLLEGAKKEKNTLTTLMNIRDYVYKVYHIAFPLEHICKYVIDKYKKEKYVLDIVRLSASCNHECVVGSKDIFVYEKFFVRLIQIVA